jgi:thiol-disulfide isomerase/thioredoxin
MRPLLIAAALYLSAAALATPASADLDVARDLAAGTVPALTFPDPVPPPVTGFTTFEGEPMDLSAYADQVVVLNFWATWCAPCRHEMPSLQRLATATEGQGIAVVPMAFGRHSPHSMTLFWEEAEIETLPLHRDAEGAMAAALGVRGLPHTFVLDADGRVVAELVGEAEWDAPEMQAVLTALAR